MSNEQKADNIYKAIKEIRNLVSKGTNKKLRQKTLIDVCKKYDLSANHVKNVMKSWYLYRQVRIR